MDCGPGVTYIRSRVSRLDSRRVSGCPADALVIAGCPFGPTVLGVWNCLTAVNS